MVSRTPWNRNTRRCFIQDIAEHNHLLIKIGSTRRLIVLKEYTASPPGCSLGGSKATQVSASVNSLSENSAKVTIDSGSSTTFISQRFPLKMEAIMKIGLGQKINLVQVSGRVLTSGYDILNLKFHIKGGLVKVILKAHIVKGIGTSFISGYNFADHYSIVILKQNGENESELGNPGRGIREEILISPLS
jgi:hypothetical protein